LSWQNISGKTRIAIPSSSQNGRGWLSSFWAESESNRRAKFYRRTKAGERQLGIEKEEWATIVAAMANALKAV
jgi:DNA-binding PadR family transcriptional regulator